MRAVETTACKHNAVNATNASASLLVGTTGFSVQHGRTLPLCDAGELTIGPVENRYGCKLF